MSEKGEKNTLAVVGQESQVAPVSLSCDFLCVHLDGDITLRRFVLCPSAFFLSLSLFLSQHHTGIVSVTEKQNLPLPLACGNRSLFPLPGIAQTSHSAKLLLLHLSRKSPPQIAPHFPFKYWVPVFISISLLACGRLHAGERARARLRER